MTSETNDSDLCVITFLTDDSDPNWEKRHSAIGTEAQLRRLYDLNALPYGVRLLKGKAARRFIKRALKEERRWQKEKHLKRQAGGLS